MKKIFTGLILLLVSMAASAQIGSSWRADWRNTANTGYLSKFVPSQPTVDCFVVMIAKNAATMPGEPTCYQFGPSFSLSGGVLNVPVTTGPQGPVGPQGPQGIIGPMGFTGDTGPAGPAGPTGADGRSAYQVAVDNGFMGDQASWLASLVGPQGPTGPTGAAGATGAQGPTGAQGVQGPKGDKGDPGTPAPAFNFGDPVSRTLTVSTAYQANDPAKAAIITVSPQCTAAITLTTGSTCTIQARVGTVGLTCSTGTVVAQWTNGNTGTLTVGLALNQTVGSPGDIKVGIGRYFILCATSGTFTFAAAVDQSAG
jgi:hypothetical protein